MFWQIERLAGSSRGLYDAATQRFSRYDEFGEKVAAVEKTLAAASKCLVMLLGNNSLLSVAAYIAALRAGHAVMLVNPGGAAELRNRIIELYTPEFIVLCGGEARLPESYVDMPPPLTGLRLVSAREPCGEQIHPDTGVLLSTSGTTGSPKFVRLSYRNIQANADSIVRYLSIDADEAAITSLPLSYSYGLSLVNSHLLAGANLVCSDDSVVGRGFWEIFRMRHCTSFAGVPFSYQMLGRLRFEKFDLPALRTMTQAGGRLAPELVAAFAEIAARRQFRFFVMYGQTEASARISYVPWERLPEKLGSVGIAVPGGVIRISGEGMELAVPGSTGEVLYEGANVMLGYADSRKCLVRGDELAGRLATGDIGFKDAEGYLYLTGRLQRFLKLYGRRVNLDEVEQMLENSLSCPVACVGNDEMLQVLVESSADRDQEEARQRIAALFQIHAASISVLRTGALPVALSGKKDYAAIEREVRAYGNYR